MKPDDDQKIYSSVRDDITSLIHSKGCPRGVMVKAMDGGIVVSEFVLQSRYEPPYPPSYWLNSTTTVLLGEWLWH